MFLSHTTWLKIRDNFEESEKQQLRDAVAGSVICPRGERLDDTKLTPELFNKVKNLVLKIKT